MLPLPQRPRLRLLFCRRYTWRCLPSWRVRRMTRRRCSARASPSRPRGRRWLRCEARTPRRLARRRTTMMTWQRSKRRGLRWRRSGARRSAPHGACTPLPLRTRLRRRRLTLLPAGRRRERRQRRRRTRRTRRSAPCALQRVALRTTTISTSDEAPPLNTPRLRKRKRNASHVRSTSGTDARTSSRRHPALCRRGDGRALRCAGQRR